MLFHIWCTVNFWQINPCLVSKLFQDKLILKCLKISYERKVLVSMQDHAQEYVFLFDDVKKW